MALTADKLKELALVPDMDAPPIQVIAGAIIVKKPNADSFINTMPGEVQVAGLTFDQQAYIIDRTILPIEGVSVTPYILKAYITKDGALGVWPLKIGTFQGRSNPWNDSALKAAKMAESRWIRVVANSTAGCYDIHAALGDLGLPCWPEKTLEEIIIEAFRDRYIESSDHEVLRRLRGEI